MRKEMKRDCWYFAQYPDKDNPDVTHYEWRKYDFITMMDNRMSDHKFEGVKYPVTYIQDTCIGVLPYEVQRARKGTGWKVVSRKTGHVVGSFDTFDEGYTYAKSISQV